MHTPVVLGHVNGAHLIGKRLDYRRHQKADNQCNGQSQNNIDNELRLKGYHTATSASQKAHFFVDLGNGPVCHSGGLFRTTTVYLLQVHPVCQQALRLFPNGPQQLHNRLAYGSLKGPVS